MASAATARYDLARIAAAVDGADIIALQEVTRNFMRNNGADMVAGLAALLPDYFHVFGAAMDIDFGMLGDDGKPANQRAPVRQHGAVALADRVVAQPAFAAQPALRAAAICSAPHSKALVMAPPGPLRVYSVHLDHVNLEERMAQIRHLKERVHAYPMEGGAITGAAEYGFPELPCPEEFVLLGDFNMVPGSPEHVAMTGAPDPVEGRRSSPTIPSTPLGWPAASRTDRSPGPTRPIRKRPASSTTPSSRPTLRPGSNPSASTRDAERLATTSRSGSSWPERSISA